MNRNPSVVLVGAMLILAAVGAGAVSAQESTEPTTELDVTLVQDPTTGNATVTVTNGSEPVADTTVNVTSAVTYAGEGQYTTDEAGTVELPDPAMTAEIDVAVTSNGAETTETFTLVPVEDSIDVTIAQNDDGTVRLGVTQYGDALAGADVEISSTVPYAGNGEYTTDANGTVDLLEPNETTEVTATVASGDLEAFGRATVEPIAEFEAALSANDDGTATVTVTRDDDPVDNASVTVTSDVPYAGNGTYTTDVNGTVALPEPGRTTNVTVTAQNATDEATTTAELSPVDTGLGVDVVQNSDGTATVSVVDDGTPVENATVNVTSDVAYDGNGTYETDIDGAVDLPSPDENVTVTVTAINGSEEAMATADLVVVENGGYATFGQWVSSYVQELRVRGYFGPGFGQKVSEFATENNPGAEKKPDHAGPKDDEDEETENAEASEASEERGPPDHAKGAKQSSENAGADGDEGTTETESDDGDDCDVEDGESTCEGDDADAEDAPGNSGDKGKSNGNGNDKSKGKARGK